MKKYLCLLAFATFAQSTAFSQSMRLYVSNTDPRWGDTITVRYVRNDTASHDTLYLAALVHGVRTPYGIVTPTKQSGAICTASLVVPDSTSSLDLFIGTAAQDQKDGQTSFTCRARSGKPARGYYLNDINHINTALAHELGNYPDEYHAYLWAYDMGRMLTQAGALHRTEVAWHDTLERYIHAIERAKNPTLDYDATLAALYWHLGDKAKSEDYLRKAASYTSFDPVMSEYDPWKWLVYPQQENGAYVMNYAQGHLLIPLFERFPRSEMTAAWLQGLSGDTLLPAAPFCRIAQAWKDSHDVDVLHSIAEVFANPKSSAHDPQSALEWCNRANNALLSGAGFYSGEYVYGFGGRIGWITALRIQLLSKSGQLETAVTAAAQVLPLATELADKQAIVGALAEAYLDNGDIQNATKTYAQALALGAARLDGLKELYEKEKQPGETMPDFCARIKKAYGGTPELPAIPDFSFHTMDGLSGSLSSLRGKVVVLDLWFIGCPGCNMEKPALNRLVEDFAGDTNVVFLSIAIDDKGALEKYFQTTPSKFRTIANGYGIDQTIGVTGYPTHIIIDKSGKTVSYEIGGGEHVDESLKPVILDALRKS